MLTSKRLGFVHDRTSTEMESRRHPGSWVRGHRHLTCEEKTLARGFLVSLQDLGQSVMGFGRTSFLTTGRNRRTHIAHVRNRCARALALLSTTQVPGTSHVCRRLIRARRRRRLSRGSPRAMLGNVGQGLGGGERGDG